MKIKYKLYKEEHTFWIVIEVNLYREEYSLDNEYYSYKEECNQEMVNFIKKYIT